LPGPAELTICYIASPVRAVILACFFLSGASGLILEMLWTRMLTLVFGSTTLAVSTVLTAFMGGLGLGSYLAGRFADRLKTPVRAYALAEARSASTRCSCRSRSRSIRRSTVALGGLRGPLRAALRAALRRVRGPLIVPTTLMGATLPILARHFVQHPWELRRCRPAHRHALRVNLFGAVAGSFFAGFVFLPTFGLRWTNVTAAAFNMTLAAAIIVARRFIRSGQADLPTSAQAPTFEALLDQAAAEGTIAAQSLPPEPIVDARARRVALGAFIVSGATAMTLQVMWTRALAVLIGSSIFSFTIILVAFLVGLGIGSAVFGRLSQRTAHPVRWLGGLHLGIAVAVGVSYLSTDRIPFVFTWLLRSTSFGVDTILVCQFVLACVTVLPATILMGGVFPLTVRIATTRLETVGRDVGNAYALNTIGAIFGSFLSGFVVLPKLGLQRGIYASVVGGPRAGRRALRRRARPAPRAPRLRRGRRLRARDRRPAPPALGPRDVLVGLLPRLDRPRVHLAPDPQEGLAGPQARLL
jgi:spermidine synthase